MAASWNGALTADVNDDLHEERVWKLILGGQSSPRDAVPSVPVGRRRIDSHAYSSIGKDTPVEEVLRRLGAPRSVEAAGPTDFTFGYDLALPDRNVTVSLHFDQQGRLIEEADEQP